MGFLSFYGHTRKHFFVFSFRLQNNFAIVVCPRSGSRHKMLHMCRSSWRCKYTCGLVNEIELTRDSSDSVRGTWWFRCGEYGDDCRLGCVTPYSLVHGAIFGTCVSKYTTLLLWRAMIFHVLLVCQFAATPDIKSTFTWLPFYSRNNQGIDFMTDGLEWLTADEWASYQNWRPPNWSCLSSWRSISVTVFTWMLAFV